MKLTLSTSGVSQSFTAYDRDWVEVNGVRHHASLVLCVDTPAAPWTAAFELLEEQHFTGLLALRPELVVFGSGARFRFPHPRLSRALTEARVGFEVMDSHAACRTFNVLAGEGRRVVAAILLDAAPSPPHTADPVG